MSLTSTNKRAEDDVCCCLYGFTHQETKSAREMPFSAAMSAQPVPGSTKWNSFAVVYHVRLHWCWGGDVISTGAGGCARTGRARARAGAGAGADRGLRRRAPVLLDAVGVARDEGAGVLKDGILGLLVRCGARLWLKGRQRGVKGWKRGEEREKERHT